MKLEENDYRGSKDFPSFEEAQAFLRDVAYRHERKLGERSYEEMCEEIEQGYLRIGSVVGIILSDEDIEE